MRDRFLLHPRLAVFLYLVTVLVVAGPSGGDPPGEPAAPPDNPANSARDRYGNTKTWYCTVRIDLHGSGHRSDPQQKSDSSYSMLHTGSLQFKIELLEGELTALTSLKEVMSRVPNNPSIAKAYDKVLNLRHWMTHTQNRKPGDEADAKSEGSLTVDDTDDNSGMVASEGTAAQRATDHSYQRGSGAISSVLIHQLAIDFANGTYALVIDPKTDLLEVSEGDSASSKPMPPKSIHVSGTDLRITKQVLPTDGSAISGVYEIPAERLAAMGVPNYGSAQGTISWTLSPTPLDDVELVLKPEGYDSWLPRGGTDEKTEGNTLRVTALLRKRGGGATSVKMKRLAVSLRDVSNEPGVCLNQPIEKGAESFDIDFSAGHNPGVQIKLNGTVAVKSDGTFTELPVTVSCYDWGAWGSLTAMASLTDGRMIWATLDGDPSCTECRIPKRERKSKIADKWKSDMGVSGLKDDDDSEKQTGNKNDGDGLTLYEEYRGLIAKKKHTRDYAAGADGAKPLTPAKKDLIVYNTIKDNRDVDAGIELLQKASGIHVVVVDDGELPDSRQVNINAGKITCGPQFGLKLADVDDPSKKTLGVTDITAPPRFGDVIRSPKGCPLVSVGIAGIKENYKSFLAVCKFQNVKPPFTESELISCTVAHELAHGFGVEHHGTHDDRPPYKEVTAKMISWTVLDKDGNPIAARPYSILGSVGEGGNDASGDVNCIMCYVDTYVWSYQIDNKTFYEQPIIPLGKTFCTSASATGINLPHALANGKKMPGFFGDAMRGRGNCLGQMKVNDQ